MNTANWVDEPYGKRLAQQLVQQMRRRDGEPSPARLALMRESRLFLREKATRIGPGMKQGTRVWYLSSAPKTLTRPADADIEFLVPGLGIYSVDFDGRGDLVSRSVHTLCAIQVSIHALGRAFERLRTNDIEDVRRLLLVPLSEHLLPETLAAEVEFATAAGRCPAVAMYCRSNSGEVGLVWMVKTLLPQREALR